MKNYTKIAFIALILTVIIALPSIVSAQTNGDDDTSGISGGTASQSQTSNGGDDVARSTPTPSPKTSNGDDDSNTSSTSNGGDDSNTSSTSNGGDDVSSSGGGSNTSSTSNGGDDGQNVTPTNSSNNNNNGGGSSSGGSRSRRNSSGTNGITSTCPYINTYMRFGGNNDVAEVTKLQNFLKNVEKIDVDVNGIFDQKTLDAVKAFQAKYINETMSPWGSNTPTGIVFITTQKKINEIVCKTPLALNADELSQIESYKNSLNVEGAGEVIGTDNTDDTNASTTEVGSKDNNQKASAIETSIFGKIWNFIKWLFGY